MFFRKKEPAPVWTHQDDERDMVSIIRMLVDAFDSENGNRNQEIALWVAKAKLKDFDRNGLLGG